MARRIVDPAEALNAKVLEDRAERIRKKEKTKVAIADAADQVVREIIPEGPAPASAAEFLNDEWDRSVFGDPIPTYKKLVYGPDRLLEMNPGLREKLEAQGLERYANATAELILTQGANAVPDPLMRKGLAAAIARFDVQSVADAFRKRILEIPVREVEIEAEREDYQALADPLRSAVEKYGKPGFAPKFMSDRSIAVLGMRGYEMVKDEHGDPVKVGTLLMTLIPQRIADARKRRALEESEEAVRDQEEHYQATAESFLRAAGAAGRDAKPLGRDELITANATETEEYLGQARPAGFSVERQR